MQYNTDKFKHGLIDEYIKIFDHLKDEKLNILEVGIFNGGSLLWMADYFKNASISGIDLKLPDISHERIKMSVCDQENLINLDRIGKELGKFDIIIDDGSHEFLKTEGTNIALFPYLKSGGLYIIEDFIADYWPEFPQYKDIHKLIFEIAENKNKLGISDFNIILKEPKCSLAIFKKK